MRKRKRVLMVIVSAVCVFGLAASSEAASGTLDIQAGGGTWQVYADVSLDNEGLSSFTLDVTGSGGLTVDGSTNEAPKGFNALAEIYGFSVLRSNGVSGIGVRAGQATLYGDVNDPAMDALVLQGIGQIAGSVFNLLPPNPLEWDAHVLLASGTYTGAVGTLSVVGEGNVLMSGSPWTGPGNVLPATWQGGSIFIPEPATIGVLLLGALAMALGRKRS